MPLTKEGKQYFEKAIKKHFVLIAEIDNKVVGYLFCEEYDISYYNFKIAELWIVCIDNDYLKQGIGMALYKEIERFFNEKGITHFMVIAPFKNEGAKTFYKKMGFEEGKSFIY